MSLLVISYPKLRPKDRQWIQAVRQQHDWHYDLVGPHFTLVFEVSDMGRDEFIAHVRPVCQETTKIAFNLRRAIVRPGVSDDSWYLFLVPDKGYRDLVSLHDRLYTGVLSRYLRPDISYWPHITVGIFKDASACKKTADELNREGFDIAGVIESVDIISADLGLPGQDRLETVEQINLRPGGKI